MADHQFRALSACLVIAFLMVIEKGFSKECYTCFSSISWEHCLENSLFFDCEKHYPETPAEDLVCLSAVRSELRTWNQQIFKYAKFCSTKDRCYEASCPRTMFHPMEYNTTKGLRCGIECCLGNKCNGDMSKGEVPLISYRFVITSALAGFILGNN